MKKLTLLLVLIFTLSMMTIGVGYAQSDIGFKGIGGRLGYIDPESDYEGTFVIGAVADLGTWMPQLHWDASLCYWSSSYDFGWAGSDYEVTLSDIAIRSGVKYHFIEGEWEPYAGGGLGLHMYSVDADWPSGYGSASDSDTEFGFYIVGGVSHQFNAKWRGEAEIQLDWADVDQTSVQVNAIYSLGK